MVKKKKLSIDLKMSFTLEILSYILVGSHLVDYLMKQGHEVVVVDNFYTGSKKNVRQWIGHANFELIHHDIVNP